MCCLRLPELLELWVPRTADEQSAQCTDEQLFLPVRPSAEVLAREALSTAIRPPVLARPPQDTDAATACPAPRAPRGDATRREGGERCQSHAKPNPVRRMTGGATVTYSLPVLGNIGSATPAAASSKPGRFLHGLPSPAAEERVSRAASRCCVMARAAGRSCVQYGHDGRAQRRNGHERVLWIGVVVARSGRPASLRDPLDLSGTRTVRPPCAGRGQEGRSDDVETVRAER